MNLKLFTMLNPKGVNLNSIGGVPDLTISEFNQACAGADPIGLEVLIRKWGGFKTEEDFSSFVDEVLEFSNTWRINGNRERKVRAIIELILFEATKLPVCSYCRGTGERKLDKKVTECHPCRGTGSYRLKDAEKARYIGIQKQSWGTWEPRYADVKCLLDNHVHEALKSINQKMMDDLHVT